MKTMTRCLAAVTLLTALTSARAASPTAVWSGTDLADNVAKGGMTLHLNGNTVADGVITIGSSTPVYIDTGLTSSSENAGTEATVVITWSNVDPSVYGAVTTFTTPSQTNAVGVECFGYDGAENNSLNWVYHGTYAGYSALMTYPNDLQSHTVAFACASPASGTGSGGYNGGAFSADGELIGTYPALVDTGNYITRINIGGYQSKYPQTGAKITRIAVYTSALTEADLKTATEEDEPEPEDPGYDEEVLASFFGFEELTSGTYTANVNGNAVTDGKVTISKGAVKLTSSETWDANVTGISVLVKYSGYAKPSSNGALLTLKTTKCTNENGLGVYASGTDGTIKGLWNGGTWTSTNVQTDDQTLAESGYMVLTHVANSKTGTVVYDGDGEIIYKATGLAATSSQQMGDAVMIGAKSDASMIVANMVIEGARIFKGALSADEITAAVEDFEADFPEPEPEPEVYGSACLYDWTFTNTVEKTSSKTIRAAAGSKNAKSMEGDNNAHYTNQVDEVYTALKSYVRPYVNVTISGGKTVACYGTTSAQTNTILFTIGNGTGNFFVATGANEGEIVLGRMASLSATIADSTLVTASGVESPSTTPHLYTVFISSDRTSVCLAIDGVVVDTKTYDSAQTINAGLQISGVYGGKPTNWLRDETVAATTAINCLRVFDHELTEVENTKLMAEFKPYWPAPPEELVPMYKNRLSAGVQTLPAGTYGAITVPEGGFWATAFDEATQLSNTESGEEIVGSYTDIITHTDKTDVRVHTFAGWFKLDALPTESGVTNVTTLYAAKAVDGTHGGYKVAVDSEGKIYVGKCGNEGWTGDDRIVTAQAKVEAGTWFHLAVSIPGCVDSSDRNSTATIFVNGEKVETTGTTFATNLDGNYCAYVRLGTKGVTSGLGLSVSGIYVDTAALTTSVSVVHAALTTPLSTSETPAGQAEITKDETTHTWIVDTTKAAYTFTSSEIAELKSTKWTVTLRSQSELGATVGFGSVSAAQMSHFIIESGTHAMTWVNGSANINFTTDATESDPSILVKTGATLNFTVRDFTGWNGAATDKTGNIVRVEEGGTLNLLPNGSSTFYYQGRFWLDPGAIIDASSFAKQKFRLNGGAVEGCEQVYMPSSLEGSAAATFSVQNGLHLATDATKGLSIFVGENSTLDFDAALTSADADEPVSKWGTGTLKLNGALTGYKGTLTINAGTLKLAEPTLGGSLVMSEGTSLDLTYDGEPKHGTVVLTATSLAINDNVAITVNGLDYVFAKTETNLTVSAAVAQVGDTQYGTILDAARAAGDGGVMTLLKDRETLQEQIDAAAITLTQIGETTSYTNNYIWAEGTALRISEIMPKPTDTELDVNGLESGWVELENAAKGWVDLANYKFIRVNRKKKTDTGVNNFPSELIGPGETYKFLSSERYPNSADSTVSAWSEGTFDGNPVKYGSELNNVMVWGDKVNPKKFCFVRLYYAPEGDVDAGSICDTVIIPSDLPESWSIVVDPVKDGVATTRWMQPRDSTGAIIDGEDLVKVGPNVGPLYEIQGQKKHDKVSEFADIVPPADTNADYEITFALNPVMHPTVAAGKKGVEFREEDAIKSIRIVYRTNLDDATLATNDVDITTKKEDFSEDGITYKAVIPKEAFENIGAGKLIQWKFIVTDSCNNEWVTPSFNNKDDGYEWYGTITEPGDLNSANLATWHMFADADSLKQMDVDAASQTLPNYARVGIYDSSTSNYYDYVRIDLRGNSSRSFTKKSHGFRFAKSHPLTMHNFVSGEDIEEIRKTSLIAEPADPSYMRQLISFWLLNKVGSPAPFDFPLRANLNGAFYQMGFNSERFTDELIEDVYKFDKYGYSYKNVGTLKSGSGTTAGSIEKKTPDDGNESDKTVLQNELRAKITAAQNVGGTTTEQLYGTDTTGLDDADLTKFVVQKFNLPAWINYLAITRITQEMDDVWANLSIYYDNPTMKEGTRGTGTWMPLAYDMNVSFGQHYIEGGVGRTGPVGNIDRFKGHPFYGGNRVRCYSNDSCSSTLNNGNDGFEAVWQNAKFRRLYLRRLRTLMDQELKTPGTAEADVPMMAKMRELEAIMHDDAAIDRAKYPDDGSFSSIDVWGSSKFPASMTAGIDDLWTNYLQPRQTHLFVTHSVTNTSDSWTIGYGVKCNAGIPLAQSDIATLKPSFGYELVDGGVKITNSGNEVIDISGWQLDGPIVMTIPSGTVLDAKQGDANGEVYIVTNRIAYCAANVDALTDQVIVGNAEAGVEGSDVTLKTADGEDVIVPAEKSDQEKYLRLWGFCGAPNTGASTDEEEFIIFTNLNLNAELDISGAEFQTEKNGAEAENRCHFFIPDNTKIAAGSWIRFNQADIPWTKITDGKVDIWLKDSAGKLIYQLYADQGSIGGDGVKNNGYFAVYDNTDETWGRMLITDAPGYEPPPTPPPVAEDVVLEGALTNDVVVTSDANIKVTLSGVTSKDHTLMFNGPGTFTIYYPEGTTNTFSMANNKAALIATNAASVVITGPGAGEFTSTKKIGEFGIIAAKDLTIAGGTTTVTFNQDKPTTSCIYLTGNYWQTNGTMNIVMPKTNTTNEFNGIQLINKKTWAKIDGGAFNATIGGTKSNAIKLKGSCNGYFNGGTITASLIGPQARVTNGGTQDFTGGNYVVTMPEDYAALTNARVFKVDKALTISGGTFDVSVPSEGSEVFATEEGLMTIAGGTFRLLSGNDCVSAEVGFTMTGGTFYGISTGNDVIDSNADIEISGGLLLAYTTAVEEDGYGSLGLDVNVGHTLTISGGTVVALGGPNSKWPGGCVFNQTTYTNVDLDATLYSEKYLVLDGELNKTTVKLPKMSGTFSLLASGAGIAKPTVSDVAPTGTQVAEGVPAWIEPKHNQQFLRFHEIYGNTSAEGGDADEYIVLTNISSVATVELAGLKVNVEKYDDWVEGGEAGSKCKFTLASGSVAPGGFVKLDQATYWSGKKQKITNGDLYIALTDADGVTVQSGKTSNDFFPECDGNGASLMAKTFGATLAMTQDDWEPSFRWYYFTSDDEAATITGFGEAKQSETTLTIPRELGKVPVTTIDTNAFAGCALTTLKVTLTNETLKVFGTGGASIATYDMSESEGELVLGYALASALDVSGTTVLGTSAATLAFDLGEGVTQNVSGTTSDATKQYTLKVISGTLNFTYSSKGNTSFRGRTVIADGEGAVVKLGTGDATGYSNLGVKIAIRNGARLDVASRDTSMIPIELDKGEVKLLAGCASGSRGFDLYNSAGNYWTVSGDSKFSVDPGIGSGDGRKLVIRQGNWYVNVASNSLFTVEPTIPANSGAATVGKIVKTGAGTLYLAATDSDYTTATEIQEGTLKLADNELQGALVMSAGTALDLHYDGTPTHGTIVLTAASLTIPDDVTITVDGVPYLFAKSETTLTIDRAVAQVNGKSYGTIVDAAKAAGDGGVMTLLLPYETLKDEIDAAAITLTPGEGENTYTNNFKWAVGTSLIISEIMPKPTDGEYDVNGVSSGWVELQNTTNAWVDLKDYKFIRVNRSKANSKGDYGNFPSDLIGPSATYKFLTSERYANSADSSVSAWEHGTFDGKPVKYGADLNNVMVWGDKVNPKKFCFVRLYYAPNGEEESIVDTVVIPSDLPESWSIKVDQVKEGVATTRWMQPRTSTGEIDSTQDLVKIGPNVGPLYEIKDGKKHTSASEFGAVLPAKIGEDYEITFALNPVMHPTEAQSKNGNFRDEDAITNITLVYRTKLSDTTVSTNVDLATQDWDAKDLGYTYQATIPHEAFDAIGDGQLIQWKFIVADKSGNTWTTPSFNNKDDGYEWYGTITEPSDEQMSSKLPTWHMFADNASLADMDKDADEQSLTYNARVAIYDSSTSNYYDYVRIDLRGNTTKNFKKKSHGFRFAKAHPLTMTDVITGETVEEIRKTSLIAEYCDPTYLRQLTSFWIWRQVGNNVPFDFPTRANLNGAFYQLGFNSERFTDELVEDVYKLDKYGYSYKSVGTLQSGGGTTAGGIEKKTPDDGDESDVSVLQSVLRALITEAGNVPGTTTAAKSSETTDPTGLDNAALTKVVVQKFDLPAWINYLASARITQECDDVWGNLCMFYDKPEMKEGTRGTGTWMPLGYDFNLSLGQHYMDGSVPRNGLKADYDWFKSHPFYGGHRVRCWNQAELTSTINYGNYGFEAVWQSAKFRRLYLRRLRTLMDQLLKEPGTPKDEVPIMTAVNTFAELIAEDAVTDRAAWPINSTANAINVWGVDNFPDSVAAGIEDLWTNYVQLRQTHLYVTHSVTNDALVTGYGTNLKAGIPLAQSDIATLKPSFGYELVDGGIKITNSGEEVIDISGWVLGGPIAMTIPNGTVLDAKQGDANGEVYIVTNRIAYCAANVDALTDQVIVGNAKAGVEGSDVTLKTASGEDVIAPDTKSEQEKYLRLWGFCGAPDEFDEDKGEFFILTNFNQTAALDVGGLDLNFCGADKLDSESKCHIVLNEGLMIPAGGWLRICLTDTDKFTGTWTKIANHQQRITICDNLGVRFIYFECVDQDTLGVYCNGYALRYDFPTESWQRMLISEMPGSEPEPEPMKNLVFTGDYPTGATVAMTNDTTVIVSNATFGAALTFTSNFVATIQVPEGTASTLPAITSQGALALEGEGTLSLSNNTTLITCCGITIDGATLNLDITGPMDDTMVAAEMKGSYLQKGGIVNMNLSCTNTFNKKGVLRTKSLYGFRWKDQTNCTATVKKSGVFNATMHNDYNSVVFKANHASNAVEFDEAILTGSFTGVDGRFVDTKGTLTIKGGSDIDVTNASTGASIFKADGKIALKKLTAKVNATGAGSKVFSSEDSIEAGHDNLVLYLISQDKCFNAETNITFTEGVVYCQSVSGNAFSTNATLKVTGGTIVALGGADSIWPNVCDFQQDVYTNNACAAEDWGEKYLVAKGSTELADVTATVKMPTLVNPFSMLVTTAGLAGDPTASEDDPTIDPIAEDVPVWIATANKTFQEYLRYINIYGSTTGKKGDVGEWFVLTNVCDKTVVLTGLNIELTKTGDTESKCKFSVTNDTSIAPHEFLKFNQADWTAAGWAKITNGDIYYKLSNNAGTIQEGNLEFCAAADGLGASMVTTNLATTLTYADWEPSFKIPSTNTTGNAGIDLGTTDPEKAEAKAKGYDVVLTDEDKAAGVEKNMLKMTAVPVTDEAGEVTGYNAVIAVNPEVVEEPEVGSGTSAQQEEVKPIVVTPDGEGNTTVSVGINNATMGLWYGYEVSTEIGTQNFANDVESFRRADGQAISIEGSPRTGNAAFFRVKVLPAKPTE